MKIQVTITGRSYDAAATLPDEIEVSDEDNLDGALEQIQALLPSEQQLPNSCLVTLSGNHLGTIGSHQPASLREGDEIMLITPVAGG